MKRNQMVFPLLGVFLLAACNLGRLAVPTSGVNATATAVVGTAIPPTEAAPGGTPATPAHREQSNEGPAATQPAKELPQTEADVRGIFDHRQDSSIFVDASIVDQQDKGSTSTNQDDQTGGPSFQSSSDPDRPKVEVVVTSQTILYKDVTAREPLNGPPPAGFEEIQQVEPGSLDEIGPLCLITVWGRQTDNRIIAEVLVYSFPVTQQQQ